MWRCGRGAGEVDFVVEVEARKRNLTVVTSLGVLPFLHDILQHTLAPISLHCHMLLMSARA